MSAAGALEAAILARLAASEDVAAILGDPPRVFDAARGKPAFPYLEIVRHEVRASDSDGAMADEHRVDLAILAADGGRDAMRRAVEAVRTALRGPPPELDGARCVLMSPSFFDMTPASFGRWRAILRVRAVVEPEAG